MAPLSDNSNEVQQRKHIFLFFYRLAGAKWKGFTAVSQQGEPEEPVAFFDQLLSVYQEVPLSVQLCARLLSIIDKEEGNGRQTKMWDVHQHPDSGCQLTIIPLGYFDWSTGVFTVNINVANNGSKALLALSCGNS